MSFRLLLPFLWFLLSVLEAPAQSNYSGNRLAIFEVQILKQKGSNLQLRCRLANTGRETIGSKNSASTLVVELDTLGLPSLLRGHEESIGDAAKNQCPKLKPGEISGPIWLNVRLKSRENSQMLGATGCAELEFDTAYVASWNAQTMLLHFSIKNTGSIPAQLFAKQLEPLVNVYFVSGNKLTRGAIPAGNTRIQKGQDTLDGLLLPGQNLEASVSIELKDRSKFSPNIALELDPAQVVDECGRNGNIWVIKLRY